MKYTLSDMKQKFNKIVDSKYFILFIVAFGLFNGPAFLKAGQNSQPPLGWTAIGIIFVFGIIGIFFVIGIQLLLKNIKAAKIAHKFFLFSAIYNFSGGLYVLVLSIWQKDFAPHSMLFCAMGSGIAAGLYLSRGYLDADSKSESDLRTRK